MSKILKYFVLISFIILAGCTALSKYDDNEVAAIVKGEEITIGELRFLYPDNTALSYMEWVIQVELVKQEVKDMGLDISDQLSDDDWFAELPPKDTTNEGGKQIRKFAKAQAKKLDMEPEEFQREYARRLEEQNAYVVTYLEEMLGEAAFDDEEGMDVFNEKSHDLLEELVRENEDDIEVLIQ